MPARRKLDRRATHVAAALAIACAALAAISLASARWADGHGWPGPVEVAMPTSTAICFLLIAAGLLLQLRHAEPPPSLATLSICAAVVGISLADAGPVLSSLRRTLEAGSDAEKWGATATFWTAIEFLTGTYCLAALLEGRTARHRTLSAAATFGLLVAGAAAVGNVFGSRTLTNGASLHVAITFVLLHAAFLLAQPSGGWMGVLLARGSGSSRARRLFPLAVVIPITMCFVALELTEAGLFTASFRLSVLAIAMVALTTTIIVLHAQNENLAQYLGQHDHLTGLANRSLFLHRLGEELARARRRGGEVGLALIDLDHFKQVNDTCGHPAGDAVLRTVAERLRRRLGPGDTAARLGGDEFAVIFEPRTSVGETGRIATAIVSDLSRPTDLEDCCIKPSVSIGLAFSPQGGWDAEELLRRSDLALYRAKAQGRGRVCVFDAEMQGATRPRVGDTARES